MEFLDIDLGSALADYEETWALQRRVHDEVVAGTRPSTTILVEHASVYTAGRRTRAAERPADGIPVVDVDRGGKITWHGPGQLVAYPIVALPDPVDVVRYVRTLEEAVIDLCASLGLETVRVEGRSGVWFPATPERLERKVCAVGVRVAKGVTMHGLALNCDPDLDAFARIVPCGITDADVTSLTAELGRRTTVEDVAPLLRDHLGTHLDGLSRRSRPAPAQDARTTTALAYAGTNQPLGDSA
ncbi:lipoyl(octanoyl) transferase LipB [Sanguibacter suaedae]|uniref:Octanoyltransferase n=1 Tax=Sanguibacter suaedae TaxID=2795737 RepID=A0A934MAI9_9MICO|nr:lipoyl(octanoyl) transferase LipB [Sanguibacter suaedae]MBI9114281.1 lipoyl(octanoyl) transferase LipB [Sanguibacter suaedae]